MERSAHTLQQLPLVAVTAKRKLPSRQREKRRRTLRARRVRPAQQADSSPKQQVRGLRGLYQQQSAAHRQRACGGVKHVKERFVTGTSGVCVVCSTPSYDVVEPGDQQNES